MARLLSFAVALALLCACAVAAGKKTARGSKSKRPGGGRTAGDGSGAEDAAAGGDAAPTFPMVVDDTRFFNNQTDDRAGPPLKISLENQDQYSRIFFTGSEGQLATTLLEELLPSDDVLDLGAEVGVFSLTAARRGVRSVTAIESDMLLATSIEQSVDINGLTGRVLVLTWLPSSDQGYATVFAKAARGCTYSAATTTNHTTEEFSRAVYTSPTRSIDEAIREQLIPRPTVVRVSMEGAEEFALEGMDVLLSHAHHAPRVILLIVYPYQLRRVMQWMHVRGYSAARDPPGVPTRHPPPPLHFRPALPPPIQPSPTSPPCPCPPIHFRPPRPSPPLPFHRRRGERRGEVRGEERVAGEPWAAVHPLTYIYCMT